MLLRRVITIIRVRKSCDGAFCAERVQPEELKALDDLEEAVTLLDVSTQTAMQEMQKASELLQAAFDKWGAEAA